MKLTLALAAVVPVALVALPLAAGSPKSAEVEVLSGSDSMTVEVNLKPLEPLSPGLRAILAFYAMRANGGCPPAEIGPDGKRSEMLCPFTTALGLGGQCSGKQLALVKEWFKDGIPAVNMDAKEAAEIGKSGRFDEACNATPYTATHQSIWSSIKVKRGEKGLVTVTGRGDWTAGPEAGGGFFESVTTYRVLADRVQVVTHHEESGK